MYDSAKVIDIVINLFVCFDVENITEDDIMQLPYDEEDKKKAINYLIDEGFMTVYIPSKRGLTMYEPGNISAHQVLKWKRAKDVFDF